MSDTLILTQMFQGTAKCPHCGSTEFRTWSLEGCSQQYSRGDWSAMEIEGDDSFILQVTCDGCERVLFDRIDQALAALEGVIRPKG
ncbi:MAG: hypothetical protein GX785_02220 [Armatimonadetes bacterium]|nr:hypothetical protein [Armatimonadota bacterium]